MMIHSELYYDMTICQYINQINEILHSVWLLPLFLTAR